MSEWQEYALGEYAKVLGGYAFKSGDFGDTGDFPVIKIKNVASGTLDMTSCQYISREVAETATRFKASRGDILIAMTGSHVHQPSSMVGKVTRYSTDDVAYINQRVGKVFSKNVKKLHEDFLFYFLKWDETTYGLALSAGGSANQANISAGQIEGLQILLPCVEEQCAVAEVLLSLDAKIDLLKQQNATLEALIETNFRQRFIVEASNDWEVVRLENILETIESGSRPKGGIDPDLIDGVPSVGAESVNGLGVYDFSKTKCVTREFYENMRRGIVKSHDVLIYKDGAYVGRKGMFGNGFPFSEFAVNEHVFVLRANEKAGQIFLYFLLQEEELAQLNSNSAQPGLNQQAMNAFEIVLPPLELIQEFEALAEPLVDKIFENANQIRTLQKLRDTLLPKLISGEVRVKQ